ncbi:MAG: tetratricopeptide repeat protein [Acidobacteria bacterium]|nr:MAG: tetratricopeptide repeat protein [Acidobacteriota bacterium]
MSGARSAKVRGTNRTARTETPGRVAAGATAWGCLLFVLVVTALTAYHPAWHGAPVWDDEAHLTHAGLRSVEGLRRIWFDLGATQQYYPLVHSTFWVVQKAWGDDPLAYHLLNIVLHALSAFLLAVILRRLAVRWYWLAALIFALHPVHVESVAWMTELKNVLSGVLYLAAALAYLRFDAERDRRLYFVSLALFVLALLSKTVTATLPAALLVVFWWQRGSLSFRRDLLPLSPFVAVGAAAAVLTAWVERTVVGAHGGSFELSWVERGLVAGRAFWFYLSKLLWPSGLVFIYPRWEVSAAVPWPYLYPIGAAALFAMLWLARRRTRAPLAAALFFAGTLFPALGFINVFPFRYSFVADHFQYLASIGVIAFVSGSLGHLAGRSADRRHVHAAVVTLAVCVPLAVLTWHQSSQFVDAETLFRRTIERNPSCWMAHNNLGFLKLDVAPEEARLHIEEALRLFPDYPEAHNNLGCLLQRSGQLEEAIRHHREAVRLMPDFPLARNNLGAALELAGRTGEAIEHYREAIRLHPDFVLAHVNLGSVLLQSGSTDEAVVVFQQAVRLAPPGDGENRRKLADALARTDRVEEAVTEYREALRLEPTSGEARLGLGMALERMGKLEDALLECSEAARLAPGSALAWRELGNMSYRASRFEQAVGAYREAVRLEPGSGEAHNNLGAALERLGRLDEAEREYGEAARLEPGSASPRTNLARVLARRGSRVRR